MRDPHDCKDEAVHRINPIDSSLAECLRRALVYDWLANNCDTTRSLSQRVEVANVMPLNAEAVWSALDRLADLDLLTDRVTPPALGGSLFQPIDKLGDPP